MNSPISEGACGPGLNAVCVEREKEESRTANQTYQAMVEEEWEEVDQEGETRKEELSSVIRLD